MTDACKLVITSWKPDEILVLAGPTGSGKTALAMELAQISGAEIVSADSMQIYREMDIGTAKVSPEERLLVPHHLIDILDPLDRYSVADYIQDAYEILDKLNRQGVPTIVCGGTGLYLDALLDGLEFSEVKSDPDLREDLQARIQREGVDTWYQRLCTLDPEAAAKIHPSNEKRLVRFFELYILSGQTMTELARRSRIHGPRYTYRAFCLQRTRSELYERINQRCIQMFEDGLLLELATLLERWPGLETAQSFQAIGYKEALKALRGEGSVSEAITALQLATRHYAKRQLSWFGRREDYWPLKL